MIQHLYSITLKDILQFIVLEQVVRLSFLLTLNPVTIHRINLNTFVYVHSLLYYVLTDVFRFVVRLEVVEVENFLLFVVGQT